MGVQVQNRKKKKKVTNWEKLGKKPRKIMNIWPLKEIE